MDNLYRVAIHYDEACGYLEYNEATKSFRVVLPNQEKKMAVEGFLTQDHEIQVPKDTLMDFSLQKVQPLDSLASFKLALTRLWGQTDVYVDWSRPVQQ